MAERRDNAAARRTFHEMSTTDDLSLRSPPRPRGERERSAASECAAVAREDTSGCPLLRLESVGGLPTLLSADPSPDCAWESQPASAELEKAGMAEAVCADGARASREEPRRRNGAERKANGAERKAPVSEVTGPAQFGDALSW